MKDKINIAELLKDCRRGLELDCSIFEDVTLYKIDTDTENEYPIRIITKNDTFLDLTKYGTYSDVEEAKCLIFPKGKTSWKDFHRPFKDGDILFYKHKSNNVKYTFIYKRRIDMHYLLQYCGWFSEKPYFSEQFNAKERMPLYENDDIRFATEEEKQKLFKAIKDNGYKWNSEAKTLEKLIEPKFKVGDRVKHVSAHTPGVVLKVGDKGYYIDLPKNGGVRYISFTLEKDYELAPNKFDINTIVPFEDKVLVRNAKNQRWIPAFWGYKVAGGFVTTFGWCKYCIPYKGNEVLFKTNKDCDDYFKTWQK